MARPGLPPPGTPVGQAGAGHRPVWPVVADALDAFRAGRAPARTATALARRTGSDRSSLDAACVQHRHAPYAQLLRAARVTRAREALLGSADSPGGIAHDCGFRDTRAMDRALLEATGADALGWRASRGADAFVLQLPPRFRHAETLAYLGRDPHSACQQVDADGRGVIALHAGGRPLRAEFALQRRVLQVRLLARGRLPDHAAAEVMAQFGRLLGFGPGPQAFERRAAREPLVRRLLGQRRGLRVTGTARPFDAVIWCVTGQQISLPFAFQLLRELVLLCGDRVTGGLRCMPRPEQLASVPPARLRALRYSAAKAAYLTGLAAEVVSGTLPLAAFAGGCAVAARERLLACRGLGPWSVDYVMMRGLGFADCAPLGDAGLRRALRQLHGLAAPPRDSQMAALLAAFAPHRSVASFHLWRSLERAAAP